MYDEKKVREDRFFIGMLMLMSATPQNNNNCCRQAVAMVAFEG